MICSKDVFNLAINAEKDNPSLVVQFLKDLPNYYDPDKRQYSIGEYTINQGEYHTCCNHHALGIPHVFNGTYRCVCTECGKACNRCFLRVIQDKKSVCESCHYLDNDFGCTIAQGTSTRKRPQCEVRVLEKDEFKDIDDVE